MGDEATHLVQTVSKPFQTITILKVWHALLILLPIKYVVELVVKSGYGLVEAMELL